MQDYFNQLGIVTWQQQAVKATSPSIKPTLTLIGEALTSASESLLKSILSYLNLDISMMEVVHEPIGNHTTSSMIIALPNKIITTHHPADLLAHPLNKKKVLIDLL